MLAFEAVKATMPTLDFTDSSVQLFDTGDLGDDRAEVGEKIKAIKSCVLCFSNAWGDGYLFGLDLGGINYAETVAQLANTGIYVEPETELIQFVIQDPDAFGCEAVRSKPKLVPVAKNKPTPVVTLTRFVSTKPQTKSYDIATDGTIKKQATQQMYEGTAERLTVSFDRFCELIRKADSRTALAFGIHDEALPDKVTIKTQKYENKAKNILCRSKRKNNESGNYFYPNKPGVMEFDIDNGKYAPLVSVSEFFKIWQEIDPNFANAVFLPTYFVRGSVSSGVHLEGEPSPFADNKHVYVFVKDARDIPRYTQILADRLWLAGYGYYAVSASGSLLDRTIIDGSVHSPEHLDFVGEPVLLNDRLRYTPIAMEGQEGDLLDTSFLNALDPNEQNTLKLLKAKAAELRAEDSKIQRELWKQDKFTEMVERGEPVEVAQSTIDAMGAGHGFLIKT